MLFVLSLLISNLFLFVYWFIISWLALLVFIRFVLVDILNINYE